MPTHWIELRPWGRMGRQSELTDDPHHEGNKSNNWCIFWLNQNSWCLPPITNKIVWDGHEQAFGSLFFIHAYIHYIRKSNGNMIIPRSAMSRPQTKHFPPLRAGMTAWDRILSMQVHGFCADGEKMPIWHWQPFPYFLFEEKMPNSARSPMNTELGVRKVQRLPGTSFLPYPPWNEAISQPGKKWVNHRLKSAGWYGDMWISRRVRIYLFACSKREMMWKRVCCVYFLHMSIASNCIRMW